jgi:hypothetical protein
MKPHPLLKMVFLPALLHASHRQSAGPAAVEPGSVVSIHGPLHTKYQRDTWSIDGNGQLGRNFSSQDDFDNLYLLLGADARHALSESAVASGGIAFSTARYMNRLLSESTIVGGRRNQRIVSVTTGTEVLSDVTLNLAYQYRFSPRLDFNGSWALTALRSKSDTQNYSVNEILALITLNL